MIDFIRINLKNHYNLVIAENGEEGLTKANSFFPEIIIIDIMMPVMDGLTMCSRIKGNPRTPHIGIILLTAKALTSQKIEGVRSGSLTHFSAKEIIKKYRIKKASLLLKNKEGNISEIMWRDFLICRISPNVLSWNLEYLEKNISRRKENIILISPKIFSPDYPGKQG